MGFIFAYWHMRNGSDRLWDALEGVPLYSREWHNVEARLRSLYARLALLEDM